MEGGGQRDLAVTPVTDPHLDHEPSSGGNVCDNCCDAEKHVFELPFFAPKLHAENKKRSFQKKKRHVLEE